MNYTYIENLVQQIEIAPDSTISRTVYQDAQVKVVLFGFAPGQELSEHTAAMPAILHIVQGEATLTLGGETQMAGPGTWVHMPAQLPHSIVARTAVVMVLLLLRGAGTADGNVDGGR